MSESRRQSAFLKSLMSYQDTVDSRLLQERLEAAERNEHCLAASCRLVGVIALIGLGGVGYSAVLLPQFFDNSSHFLVQFFSALGLGSLMCLAVFLGLWLWYRSMTDRIQEECRSTILEMIESRFQPNSQPTRALISEPPVLTITCVETASSSELKVRRAS